jgi:cation diffusion facilitator CzcD-associated flavoprotein CzcO
MATASVGAGLAGMAMARALRETGVVFEVFQRHSDFGGIWDVNFSGSPIYQFPGYPMPDGYPDYPNHYQIVEYLRGFAKAYGLRQHVTVKCVIPTLTRTIASVKGGGAH